MAKQIPVRQCIGCRRMMPKNELVRVIRTPEQEICLDKTGKKNGRGAYICPNKDCLNQAIKSKGLSRALQTEIPEDIYRLLGEELM